MPIEVLMPALSPTMTEGNLAKWHKKEGDAVKAGDVLAEIETDKATMEVEAVDEGTLGRILVPEGAQGVKVNQPIALILGEDEDAKALAAKPVAAAPGPAPSAPLAPAPAPAAAPAAPPAPAPAPAAAAAPQRAAPSPGNGHDEGKRVLASPLARRMAVEGRLDLAAIAGSGPHGRIVKSDIEGALAGGGAVARPRPAQAPAAAPRAPGVGRTKNQVAAEAGNIPYTEMQISAINAAADAKISVNDFVIKAVALALKKVPEANASWSEDAILRWQAVDIAVAVALDDGLITPIIKGADAKGLAQISAEMKDLAARAKTGKLKLTEFQGGTFSISNLGMYGVREFAAVINPPHGCILAIGAGEQRAVVKAGALAVATVMSCTLACDHRVVDGATGARWLQAFKKIIEAPALMAL
jgi:pyruvate dehydrogenase E2 component (dihydrolipoamide acetyltransferase)